MTTQDIYVINGFYMAMREKFTKPGASIYYYDIEWDSTKLSWDFFRANIIGSTDPINAVKGSMRNIILQKYKEFGLKSVPNIGDNGIHASASPFEGLCERINWLERQLVDDEFGRLLLDSGIPQETIMKWTLDPQINFGGRKTSLFDSLEDINADECIIKSQLIAEVTTPVIKTNKNQAFLFIKPHAVTQQIKEFVTKRLDDLKIKIVSQGTLDAATIQHKKLIDKHYYAIANKASFSQPKDLNLPQNKKEDFFQLFGVKWESALSNGIIFNAVDASKKFSIDGDQLNKLWAAAKNKKQMIKFGGGFYCAKLNIDTLSSKL